MSSFTFYIYVFDPYWVHFFIWYEVGLHHHCFACGNPLVPAPLVKNTILSPLNCFSTHAKHQWTTNVKIYFWIFNSISLLNLSKLLPEPYCTDYWLCIMLKKNPHPRICSLILERGEEGGRERNIGVRDTSIIHLLYSWLGIELAT